MNIKEREGKGRRKTWRFVNNNNPQCGIKWPMLPKAIKIEMAKIQNIQKAKWMKKKSKKEGKAREAK